MPSHSLDISEDFCLCSICLDVFKDPVTTPCGHNFCKSCINNLWDNDVHPRCPNCHRDFEIRPDMEVNTFISEITAQLKNQQDEQQETKAGHTSGDAHTGSKLKTLKSCLACGVCVLVVWMVFGPNILAPLKDVYKGMNLETMDPGFQQMIQRREEKIQEIQRSVELSKKETEESMKSLRSSFKKQIHLINEKQRNMEKLSESLVEELKQEITELRRRIDEEEQLSVTNLVLLKELEQEITELKRSNIEEEQLFVTNLEEVLIKEMRKQERRLISEAKMKRFHQHAVDLTLDPKTAHPSLILSDDRRQVYHSDRLWFIGQHVDIATSPSVLSQQSFSSGRFYFEVQVKGKTAWDLGVAAESVNRSGFVILDPQSGFWTLMFRNKNKCITAGDPLFYLSFQPEKVGVFVDYEEGLVSFYDVDAAALIYSFSGCSFTGGLYPYFSPQNSFHGENSAPLIISTGGHSL